MSTKIDTFTWTWIDSTGNPFRSTSFALPRYSGDSALAVCQSSEGAPIFTPITVKMKGDSTFFHQRGPNLLRYFDGKTACQTCMDTYQETYQPKWGFTEGYLSWLEVEIERKLVGAVRDGDTIGYLTPEAVLTHRGPPASISTWQVYPNPTRGTIILDRPPHQTFHTATWHLTDLRGRVLDTFVISGSTQHLRLDLSRWPAGMYVLRRLDQPQSGKKLILR